MYIGPVGNPLLLCTVSVQSFSVGAKSLVGPFPCVMCVSSEGWESFYGAYIMINSAVLKLNIFFLLCVPCLCLLPLGWPKPEKIVQNINNFLFSDKTVHQVILADYLPVYISCCHNHIHQAIDVTYTYLQEIWPWFPSSFQSFLMISRIEHVFNVSSSLFHNLYKPFPVLYVSLYFLVIGNQNTFSCSSTNYEFTVGVFNRPLIYFLYGTWYFRF